MHDPTEAILPWPTVKQRVGDMSRRTVQRNVRAGTFPKPVKISARRIGWRESDLNAWIRAQAEMGND